MSRIVVKATRSVLRRGRESNLSDLSDDVQFVHVKCRVSGTGHIRLRLKHKKHTGGNWINRDPAAVADTTSGNVRSIWCEDGYLIAYDPSWIFTDLYSS
ncbi:hypothetical protein [uncultured Methanobrevibacter sp.]|uniref:hypothetical protein n=1 Tax=uncultured Methanobrevibacter sp. TaxID=253161 RepID=UPI0025D614D3|nr:hypothetical protein [uncultured Methanobrevibacter sp.]